MQTASYSAFRITVADGWAAHEKQDSTSVFLSITPHAHAAELRLTTCGTEQMKATEWIEFATHTNRLKNRPVSKVAFGPLTGYETQFIGGNSWIRGWVLEGFGLPLDITYRCDVSLRGRDDDAITLMLQTLKMDVAAETDKSTK